MDKNQINVFKEQIKAENNGEITKRDIEIKIAKFLKSEYNMHVEDVLNRQYESSEEYEAEIKKHIPENFCVYPFVHFQLDPDGRSRPCCKYGVGGAWSKDVPKLPVYDIGQLWNQQEIQEVRSAFLRNERPANCKACWDEEAAGITSMRLSREDGGKRYPYATIFKNIFKPYPESIDLKLSNLCNLKCRICTPFLSTQWIKEINDLNITDTGTREMYVNNSREKFIENGKNIEILKEWATTITNMEFYGGEPLMQQEHDAILNVVAEYGNPAEIGINYNTNGTICEERFFEIWKKFKSVSISFSIDDLGSRYEYERKNAKWNEVIDNINRYQTLSEKHGVNLHTRIYITVGILNVFYLKEVIDYFRQFDFEIVLNNVHYPAHYSIFNLPNEIKDKIKEKLLSIDTSYKTPSWSPTIDQMISFMYVREPNNDEFEKFLSKTQLHDDYRNESFKDTFSEFYDILQASIGV